LDEDSYAVAWDSYMKYGEFVESRTVFVHPGVHREARSSERRAPLLVAHGGGGALGFFLDPRGTLFGRWDATGRLVRQRRVAASKPLQAVRLGGGVVLRSAGGRYERSHIEWFAASGERIEGGRGSGGYLFSDRRDRLAELVIETGSKRLLGRFGESPSRLGDYRVLVTAPPGRHVASFCMAFNRRNEALLTFGLEPFQPECGFLVQGLDRDGAALTAAVCAGGDLIDPVLVTPRPDDRFWLVWRSVTVTESGDLATQIQASTVELAPTRSNRSRRRQRRICRRPELAEAIPRTVPR
jgi:hypothetical protein